MLFDYFLDKMNNLSVLRATLKQKLHTHHENKNNKIKRSFNNPRQGMGIGSRYLE